MTTKRERDGDVSPTSDALPRARRRGARVSVGGTNAAILRGDEDLSVWSDEELRRGQRKSARGRWEGRPPAVVPKAIHDELVRRTMDRATGLLVDNLVDAVQLLGEVVRDPAAKRSDRIRAADIIMNRVLPKQITIKTEMAPWEKAFEAATRVVIVDGEGNVPPHERDRYALPDEDEDVIEGEWRDADE